MSSQRTPPRDQHPGAFRCIGRFGETTQARAEARPETSLLPALPGEGRLSLLRKSSILRLFARLYSRFQVGCQLWIKLFKGRKILFGFRFSFHLRKQDPAVFVSFG